MTVVVRAVSGPLEDPGIREKVYGGEILVFKSIEAMAEFCSFADGLIREVLDTEDPLRAQFEIGGEGYLQKAEELQRRFRKENWARVLLCEALRSAGVDPRHTFWDRPYLRTSPHGGGSEGHQTAALGFHRDTWASKVYSQINWWAPIYPIDAGRTIAFYPEYWQSLLNNTSAEWDLEEIRAGKNLPLVPEPVESVSTVSELRVVLDPGDLLCFSGAHLHASVPNATGVARFSVEVRTASAEDEARGQGASNLDGQAPHRALSWFRHMEDELSLSEALVCCGEGEPAG
jgi:hypothetical protein